MIEMFRFDPNEDRGARTFRVDNVKLADDDAGETAFTIRLHDAAPGAGTRVSLFADTDRAGFDGTAIASDVDMSSGSANVEWTPPAGTRGTFWIYALASRGGTSARTYATGPVRIGSATPAAYQFGGAVGGPFSQINVGAVAAAPDTLGLVASSATVKPTKKKAPRTTRTTTRR